MEVMKILEEIEYRVLGKFFKGTEPIAVKLQDVKSWQKEEKATLKRFLEEGLCFCRYDQIFLTDAGINIFFTEKAIRELSKEETT